MQKVYHLNITGLCLNNFQMGFNERYRWHHRHYNKGNDCGEWTISGKMHGTGNATSPWQRQLAVAETRDHSQLRRWFEWLFGCIQGAMKELQIQFNVIRILVFVNAPFQRHWIYTQIPLMPYIISVDVVATVRVWVKSSSAIILACTTV